MRPGACSGTSILQSLFLSSRDMQTQSQQDDMGDAAHTHAHIHDLTPYFLRCITSKSSSLSGDSLESFQERGCVPVEPGTPTPTHWLLSTCFRRAGRDLAHLLGSETPRSWCEPENLDCWGDLLHPLQEQIAVVPSVNPHSLFFYFLGLSFPLPPLLSNLHRIWSQ